MLLPFTLLGMREIGVPENDKQGVRPEKHLPPKDAAN